MIKKKNTFRKFASFLLAILMILPFMPMKEVRANEYIKSEPPLEAKKVVWSKQNQIKATMTWDPKQRWDGSGRAAKFYAFKGQLINTNWIYDENGDSYFCIEPGVTLSTTQSYYRAGEYNGKMAEEIKLAVAFLYNMDFVDGQWILKDKPSFNAEIQLNSVIWALLGRARSNAEWMRNNVVAEITKRINQQMSGSYSNPEHFAGEVKIYRYETKDRKAQTILGYSFKLEEKETKLSFSLKKESTNPSYVKGNPNYSLAGAEYGIYATQNNAMNDKDRLGTFTSDSNGDTNSLDLAQGTYYVKETKAPKGYELDPKPYKVELSGEGQTFTVKDKPKTDPLTIMLKKTDIKGVGLADAEFEVKYYEELTSDVSGLTPKYTWKFKTNSNGVLSLNDSYKIGGDALPIIDGAVAGLIGTYTIQETKAPSGYVLDDTLHIRQLKEEGGTSNVLTFNAPTQPNESQKMRFTLQKEDVVNQKAHTEGSLEKAIYDVIVVESVDKDLKKGDVVKTVETDKDGKVLVDELELGIYDIVEKTPSKGYSLNPVAVRVEGIKDNSGNEYTLSLIHI